MIGVGTPWILGATVFAALVITVLHFLSVRRPPVLLLPTMRFLPDRPVRAVSRSARPSDLLLLLLRVAALLLAGVALSGLYWRAAGVKHGRVVVIQRGNGDDTVPLRDAASRALSGAFVADTVTRVVVIDSVAHVLADAESRSFKPETLSALGSRSRGSTATFSAAVLAATRAASALVRDDRSIDVVDLVIAAPFLRGWNDAASGSVRASWPGVIRFSASTAATVDSSNAYKRSVTLVGAAANDAVKVAFAERGWLGSSTGSEARTTNSSNANTNTNTNTNTNINTNININNRTTSNGPAAATVPVEWPASGVPEGWTATPAKTIGAVVARGEALVFPFPRTARATDAILAQGRALAWWNDGQVAAVEIPSATGCTRHVGIPVPSASDVLQGQAARALLLALSGPCGGEREVLALTTQDLQAFAGSGAAAPASAFRSAAVVRTPWAPLLLALALVLLIIEWYVRDREERVNAVVDANAEVLRRVA